MSGYVALHREAREHPLFAGDVARFGAFFWLVATACWKPTPFNVRGTVITLQRGQLCVSIRQLAEAWGWSKSAVERFLTRLETETMILREAGHGRCIITVCNYNTYQDRGEGDRDTDRDTSGTPAGHQRDTKEKGNKGIREEEPSGSSSPPTPRHVRGRDWPEVPDWIPVGPWNGFIDMRKRKRANPTAHAVTLLIAKLDQLRTAGNDPGAVLDQSTERNWTGLFELKDDRHATGTAHAPRDTRDGFTRALDRELERLAAQPPGPA